LFFNISGLKRSIATLNRRLSVFKKMKRIFWTIQDFVSLTDLSQEEHVFNDRVSQIQKNANTSKTFQKLEWHMELFSGPVFLEAKLVGRISYLVPIGRAQHQTPWVESEESRNCLATHTLQMKDGTYSYCATSEPSFGAHRHTCVQ
jgi:hypothetical protein